MNNQTIKRCLVFIGLAVTHQIYAQPHVILDIGHSPKRGGAVSPTGYKEYDYNVILSQKIWLELRNRGIEVSYSRPGGAEVSLTERTKNTAGVDLFVSIHHDSMHQEWIDQGLNKTLKGHSVFISKKNPYLAKSYFCAQNVGYQMNLAGEKPSLYHAVDYKGKYRPLLDRNNGVHQFDDLIVLKSAKSPAILIEAGVITNPYEEDRLMNPSVTNLTARGIAQAISDCLKPVQQLVQGR